jgi:hypothetical protein
MAEMGEMGKSYKILMGNFSWKTPLKNPRRQWTFITKGVSSENRL